MPIDAELEEVLLRWEEQQDLGEPISIEKLCRDIPERIEEARHLIQTLRNVDARILSDEDNRTGGPETSKLPADLTTLSRFRAIRWHAQGGLGDIFVAYDESLRREVALKLIQRPYDAERRKRFLREAEITARLGHPGIVPVFAVGHTADGQPCYAMRYIEGETLRAAIARFHESDTPHRDPRERTLAFRGLLSRLIAVCQAVAFAHSRGVIHRDLKPDNVMLGPFQETLVVDWGLAKHLRVTGEDQGGQQCDSPLLDSVGDDTDALSIDPKALLDDSLTRLGTTLGTPAYMSPEQADGRASEVGSASDIYSLGATLYVLLTGRSAFQNRSRATLLDQVRRGEFPTPRLANELVPPALGAVCLKAMALRPSDRYSSALDLAIELERWLADEPVLAWREMLITRLGRWVRRHRPLVAASVALGATALVALSVTSLLLGKEQNKTKIALDDSRANYRLARTTLADVQTSFGLLAADRQAPMEGVLWFAEASEKTSEIDADRAFANRIRARSWARFGATPVTVLEFPERPPKANGLANGVNHLAFDGTGRYIFAVSQTGVCVVHDIRDDTPVQLSALVQNVTVAAWGGKAHDQLAIGTREGVVELIAVPSGSVVKRFELKVPVESLEFSHDGNLLAFGSQRANVWNLASGCFMSPDLPHPGRIVHLVFNAKGNRLATAAVDGVVRVYEIPAVKGEPILETQPYSNIAVKYSMKAPFRPVFVDHGEGILILASDRELVWIDSTTGEEVRRLPTDLNIVHNVFLNKSEDIILLVGIGGGRFLDAKSGKPLGRFDGEGPEASAFSIDERWLLVADGHYQASLYEVPSGARQDWGLPHQGLANQMGMSPDRLHFAFSQTDGLVRVYKLHEGPYADRLLKTPSASARLAMSADGNLVMPLGKDLSVGPTFTQVHTLATGHAGPDLPVEGILHGGAIAPDGRSVVTLSSPSGMNPLDASELKYPVGSAKGSVQFWDWKLGKPLLMRIPTPSEPIGATYSPNGNRLAVVCAGGELLWIDPSDGRILHTNPSRGFKYAPGWPGNEMLRFSPDGRMLVIWGIGAAVIFNSATGAEYTPKLALNAFAVLDASFSADSLNLALSDQYNNTRVWDLKTGRCETPILMHPDWVFQSRFSADGSLLLTGCRDGKGRVWNWRIGELIGPPLVHSGEVQDVAFLNHDQWVLTRTTKACLQIWDYRSGKPLIPSHLAKGTLSSQLCVAPNGQRAAIGSETENGIHVLNLSLWMDQRDPRFSAERIRTTAEVLSGQRIVGGSTVVSLTTEEWLNRWRAYKADRDGHLPTTNSGTPGNQDAAQ